MIRSSTVLIHTDGPAQLWSYTTQDTYVSHILTLPYRKHILGLATESRSRYLPLDFFFWCIFHVSHNCVFKGICLACDFFCNICFKTFYLSSLQSFASLILSRYSHSFVLLFIYPFLICVWYLFLIWHCFSSLICLPSISSFIKSLLFS